MSEQQMNRLELIIQNWINQGAPCDPSLKPYKRSLEPTYHRQKRTKHSMIKMCEDYLRSQK